MDYVIILSDICIGIESPSVRYRKEVHEKNLITIFNDIIAYADQIIEVILLGDIFEFWAYPPQQIPPTLDDIIAANPVILGQEGKLIQALNALKGRMVYIPGDHDMNVNEGDMQRFKSLDGYTIKYRSVAYIPSYDKRVLFTHGHQFTMLNAPYFDGKLKLLPFWYFVERSFAYKGQNCDTQKSKWKIESGLMEIGLTDSTNFIINIIDVVSELSGMSKELPIQINGQMAVSLNDVKVIYQNLLKNFPASLMKQGLYDQEINNLSFSNPLQANYLQWYVQNVFKDALDLVMTGNSHSSIQASHEFFRIYKYTDRGLESLKGANTDSKENENPIIPPGGFTFGWSVYNASWAYYMTMQMGVLTKAEELGINVIAHDQKSNAVEMEIGCISLINNNVNALLISPYYPEGVPYIAEYAAEKNIPVVVIDGGTGGADVAAFIVSDSFGGGILAGEYALILIKQHKINSKNIAIIKAEKTATYALLRGKGFKSVMLEKGYQVVAEVSANGEQEDAYLEMTAILQSYANDLAVVFCENGLMTVGAAQALEEAGKKGVILIIGFDADPAVLEKIQEGVVQGTVAQQPYRMGEIGVEIANAVLLGIPVVYDNYEKKEILMEVYLINQYGEAVFKL
ncbi:substrate-binding domain-containing protein [Anaeromicropila populeti]|uniref:ABC-type sugar transport system, substrate-binding protein, contains N-terminal xre family HTH domain n=1 Tax=Anaeromicropila populeti TaxID=37658 RepID=A0A1I6L699_9FIRM|nr:substrate-binding domain-containing protein [Anaeromicropila populeti]SFR98952.1 ABC-type sugar transport system, substrate-binding protein, contains N-terminal xre family HTH domain [Anaeromicropila populeti]